MGIEATAFAQFHFALLFAFALVNLRVWSKALRIWPIAQA